MTAAHYIYDIANDILSVAEDSLSENRTGNPRPKRLNVAWGIPPVDDCGCADGEESVGGQLTVHLENPGIQHKIVGRQNCAIVPEANFVITLYRCVSTLTDAIPIPDQDELDNDGARLFADMWALLKGVYAAIEDGSLYDGCSCDTVRLGDVELLQPEGGCAGFTVRVTVLLNDRGPTVS